MAFLVSVAADLVRWSEAWTGRWESAWSFGRPVVERSVREDSWQFSLKKETTRAAVTPRAFLVEADRGPRSCRRTKGDQERWAQQQMRAGLPGRKVSEPVVEKLGRSVGRTRKTMTVLAFWVADDPSLSTGRDSRVTSATAKGTFLAPVTDVGTSSAMRDRRCCRYRNADAVNRSAMPRSASKGDWVDLSGWPAELATVLAPLCRSYAATLGSS